MAALRLPHSRRIRADYPLSLHGVGLSLGSADPLDIDAPGASSKRLAARIEPAVVSEHLCWSHVDGRHLNDLLPLPLTRRSARAVCDRVDAVQDRRWAVTLLVENVSSLLRFAEDTIPEWDFVAAVATRTGCKLLLDVNNVYVNAVNHGFDAAGVSRPRSPAIAWPRSISPATTPAAPCLIDTHGSRVAPPVWSLYARRDRALRAEADPASSGTPTCRRSTCCSTKRRRPRQSWTSIAMPSLIEIQRGMAAATISGDAAALAGLGIVGGTIGPAARVDIYRNNVFGHYRKALAATFPVVSRLVGAAFFDAAVDAFVRAHPSTRGDVNRYGGELARFLADYPPARALAYLPDVARLEWAIDQAAIAAEAPPFDLAALAALPGDAHAGLRFVLHPSAQFVESRYPILRIWQVNQPDFEGAAEVDLDEGGDLLLVARGERGVDVERLELGVAALLRAFASGESLAVAASLAAAAEPSFDLATALRRHVASQLLVAFVAPESSSKERPR